MAGMAVTGNLGAGWSEIVLMERSFMSIVVKGRMRVDTDEGISEEEVEIGTVQFKTDDAGKLPRDQYENITVRQDFGHEMPLVFIQPTSF